MEWKYHSVSKFTVSYVSLFLKLRKLQILEIHLVRQENLFNTRVKLKSHQLLNNDFLF